MFSFISRRKRLALVFLVFISTIILWNISSSSQYHFYNGLLSRHDLREPVTLRQPLLQLPLSQRPLRLPSPRSPHLPPQMLPRFPPRTLVQQRMTTDPLEQRDANQAFPQSMTQPMTKKSVVTTKPKSKSADDEFLLFRFVENITETLKTKGKAYKGYLFYIKKMTKNDIFCALYEKLDKAHLPASEKTIQVHEYYNCTLFHTEPHAQTHVTENVNDRSASFRNINHVSSPKKTNVVFVKVHKAASTTVQNVLLRFAFWNQLNVILSKDKLHLNENYSNLNRTKLVSIPPNEKFNILCNHLIFNKTQIEPYFPNDTAYIGIVRNPFDRFFSAFRYYSTVWSDPRILGCTLHYLDPVEAYLNARPGCINDRMRTSHLYYRMIRDFGFPFEALAGSQEMLASRFVEFLSYIKRNIDFVLVVEKFDESLVLMRRFLGWSLEDILYVKLNFRKLKTKIKKSSLFNDDRTMANLIAKGKVTSKTNNKKHSISNDPDKKKGANIDNEVVYGYDNINMHSVYTEFINRTVSNIAKASNATSKSKINAIRHRIVQDILTHSLNRVDVANMRELYSRKNLIEETFYGYFYVLLQNMLMNQPEDILQEVAFFQEVRKRAEEFCSPIPSSRRFLIVRPNKWTLGFRLTRLDCFLMYTSELSFTKLTRTVQHLRFNIFKDFQG